MVLNTTTPPRHAAGPDEFDGFCSGVRRLCGIDLAQYKRGQMERRVRSFAERRGCPSLVDYLRALNDRAELDAFLDRVTINVSQLWRNPSQWTLLQDAIIPELLGGTGRMKAWSAGCSYGAEALTLAAITRDAGRAVRRPARAQIDATDIDPRIIEKARTGSFSSDDARDAPGPALTRWFSPTGDGGWQAAAELLSDCSFEVGDLLRMPARRSRYDLVLCRNTVIYFTDEVRDALHARLAESIRPGGYLVIGGTERVADPAALGLETAHPFTYRKAS